MQIERIHFDRVFDIQPSRGEFSFSAGNQVQYSARLPGRTIPREGATWAVAFERPGDWSTLLGWRDLSTQNVMLERTLSRLVGDQFDLAWFAGIPLLVAILILGTAFGAPAAAVALLITAVAASIWYSILVMRRNQRVRAALLQI